MTTTANYGFTLPTVGGDDAAWGGLLNTNWTDLDADLTTIQTDIDSRILTSGIGSAVQAFDATIMVDADVGSSVQAWDAQLDTLAGISSANATAVGNLTGTNSGDELPTTTSAQGTVEKSTSGENVAGTEAEKYPSVAGVKEMIDTHAVVAGIGVAQTWQDVSGSRASDLTVYQNSTGKPIQVTIHYSGDWDTGYFEISADNSSWVRVYYDGGGRGPVPMAGVIVPAGHYYRSSTSGGTSDPDWFELRA